jgi:uncharacterized protein (DUF1697 family)
VAVFIALLRAINVGGTGALPMKKLCSLCTDLGFGDVRTYIQSGNVVFESSLSEQDVQDSLGRVLSEEMGKRVDVMVRTAAELRAILEANPFPNAQPAQVAVVFLSGTAPKGLLDKVVVPGREELRLGKREIYIHYPDGMGRSKLKLPSKIVGTARNINTVTKLDAMAAI